MSRDLLRNWLGLLLILVFLGSVTVCFLTSRTQTCAANGYSPELFGVGEPLMSRSIWENGTFSLESAFDAVRSLNVTRLRETTWMSLLLVNETSLNVTGKEALDWVISNMTAINVTVMGMSQDFPNWMRGIVDNDSQVVPYRNATIGSDYMKFLQRYNESWQTLASSFPNIATWEIGNEYNADPFLHPQGYNRTTNSPSFTIVEKAEIATDLLYYGSSGVHLGNPNATTVLGGLSPGSRLSEIADFLEKIYDNIESGLWPSSDSNDYFQIACWHPYLWTEEPNSTNWVDPDQAIYEVMNSHGDGGKRVVFSEFGYNDNETESGRANVAIYLNETFELAHDFQWLDTIYWFRLAEPRSDTESQENPSGFGLFYPDWTPKPAAIKYQLVTPEFPSFLILPLFMIAALVAVIIRRRGGGRGGLEQARPAR